MKKNPNISVVLAVYNESKYILIALKSILSQQDVAFEIILVDDQSTDDTLKLARNLAETDTRIKVFRNPNKGKCYAFNYGVKMANGRFICIFAGDDIMPPGSLFQRFNQVNSFDDSMPVVGLSKLITISDIKKYDGHLIPRAAGRSALSGVSPLMNKLAVDLIFPTPESLPNEDTWMELAILHLPGMKVKHSNIICCQARIHQDNSINMLVPFEVYNKKITLRMEAMFIFKRKYYEILDDAQKDILDRKIYLEQKRRDGDVFSLLFARGLFVDRLRAISITNKYFFAIRKFMFGLFSGW